MCPAPFSQENMVTITAEKDGAEYAAHSKLLSSGSRGVQGNITSVSMNGDCERPSCRVTSIASLPITTRNLTT